MYNLADKLSKDYTGSMWNFYGLNDGGFFMTPDYTEKLKVGPLDNYYKGEMSPRVFGITVCLYAYSKLSFTEKYSEIFTELYHKLRNYVATMPQASDIYRAID